MTTIQLNLNNLSESEALFSIFPASNKYEFTGKKVFRLTKHVTCHCGCQMVHNGHNFVRKNGFGKVKIGKQICLNCGNQHYEDKSFWKKLLSQWKEIMNEFIMTLRDADVS